MTFITEYKTFEPVVRFAPAPKTTFQLNRIERDRILRARALEIMRERGDDPELILGPRHTHTLVAARRRIALQLVRENAGSIAAIGRALNRTSYTVTKWMRDLGV